MLVQNHKTKQENKKIDGMPFIRGKVSLEDKMKKWEEYVKKLLNEKNE